MDQEQLLKTLLERVTASGRTPDMTLASIAARVTTFLAGVGERFLFEVMALDPSMIHGIEIVQNSFEPMRFTIKYNGKVVLDVVHPVAFHKDVNSVFTSETSESKQ